MSGEPLANGERFLDNVSIDGAVPEMIDQALFALRRNMNRRAIIKGAGQEDMWDYPETALREALVNALVHRDYSPAARGTQMQIEMYPDRLRIRNPGGLYGPITLADLMEEGTSSSRNGLLLRILEDVPLPSERRTVCENRGSGVRAMISALRAANMRLPKFEDRVATFDVTFPNHALLSEQTVAWITSLNEDGLTDSQISALAFMKEGGNLNNRKYRGIAGVDSRVATTELGDLVARELVDQDDERRWARYKLSKRASEFTPAHSSKKQRLPRTDRRIEILDAIGHELLSRRQIQSRTGLSAQTVSRWLTILKNDRRIEMIANTAGKQDARYRRRDSEPRLF